MSEQKKRAEIATVHAKNVKCVRLLELDDVGNWLEIRGDAGQGKTTALESVIATLQGMDKDMIAVGENHAEFFVDLGVAKVKRTVWREEGKPDTLKVSDGETGYAITKAQTFLNTLSGASGFRILDFVRLGSGDAKGKTERLRKQREMLLEAVPAKITWEQISAKVSEIGPSADAIWNQMYPNPTRLDVARHAIDVCKTIEQVFYEARRNVNAEADRLDGVLRNTVRPAAAPIGPVSEFKRVEDDMNRAYREAYGAAGSRKANEDRAAHLKTQIEIAEGDLVPRADCLLTISKANDAVAARVQSIKDIERQISELQSQLADNRSRLEEERSVVTSAENDLRKHEAIDMKRQDLAAIQTLLANVPAPDLQTMSAQCDLAKQNREAREQMDRYEAAERAAKNQRSVSENYDAVVKLFRDTVPQAIIQSMKMPVSGLGIEGDVVTYNGVPLHQLGTSEQTYVAAQISRALNPNSDFILIDGGESMGQKDLLALRRVQEETGCQFLITFVDAAASPKPGVVVMKDGAQVK